MPRKTPAPIPVTQLQGVRSADDLGPWTIVDVVAVAGGQRGKVFRRERVYGLKHPNVGLRYGCGQCDLTFTTITGADKHRQTTHPFKRGGPRQELQVAPTREAEQPRQMTFDEIGMDTIGPAIAEGVAAIVASRQGLRDQVNRLESENETLRTVLKSIVNIANNALGEISK